MFFGCSESNVVSFLYFWTLAKQRGPLSSGSWSLVVAAALPLACWFVYWPEGQNLFRDLSPPLSRARVCVFWDLPSSIGSLRFACVLACGLSLFTTN